MFKGITSLDEVDQCDNHDKLPWNKLEKTFKLQKLYAYADKCAQEHACDAAALKILLKEKLARKCLQKGKDVNYDKVNSEILSIPSLTFNGSQFIFKHADNVSPLTFLSPKNKTVKIKI